MEVGMYEISGKYVRITIDTGQIFEGKAIDFIPYYDNTPEITSISIGCVELFENQIVSIEEVPDPRIGKTKYKMTAKELRNHLLSTVGAIDFYWRDVHSLVSVDSSRKYILSFFGQSKEFNDVDEMMKNRCFHGHSLADICDEIEFYR